MSLVKSIVKANDEQLVGAHQQFLDWKSQHFGDAKTNFGYALKHFASCKRAITRICPSFTSDHSYARGISTTYVYDKKIYWKEHSDPCWKKSRRKPPPVPRNGGRVRVLFDHQRDAIYRYHGMTCISFFLSILLLNP